MAADKDGEDYLTLKEVAQKLGKCEWTIRDWISKGKFTVPIIELPGRGDIRVRARQLDRWMTSLERTGPNKKPLKGKAAILLRRKLQEDDPDESH